MNKFYQFKYHIFLNLFLTLSFFINLVLTGNGLDVKNQLLLMPYPKKVEAAYSSTLSLEISPQVSYTLSENCIGNCKDFIDKNFKHSITKPLERQKGKKDFKISLHEPIDIPHIIPDIQKVVTSVDITFGSIEFFNQKGGIFNKKEIFPKLAIGVDESYSLFITVEGITIKAPTAYGARHALETLLQLIRIHEDKFVISQLPITIHDEPRFRWRGLMVDPSRNVLSPSIFYNIIDSLASIKSNVLHIHLSDGQAFTFESKKYPNLSLKGMYDQKKVFTQEIVKQLADYGRERGVIVYGEVDIPGHAASWGLGYPEIVADCWDYLVKRNYIYGENIPCLNPASQKTWEIMDAVLQEIGDTFGNDYVHIGGDEVSASAWSESKEVDKIKTFMINHNIASWRDLESYFNKYAQTQVKNNKKTPIVWEEVYTHGAADKSSIIHVWSDIRLLSRLTNEGYKGIYSAGLYLDRQMPLCTGADRQRTCVNTQYMWVWVNRDFYSHDPTRSFTPKQLENVYGGEGCSWGESCDDQNFFDRVFQRYSAIGERFWSEKSITNPNSHEVRANYVRCLNLRRGFFKGTGPLYHSFCDHIEE